MAPTVLYCAAHQRFLPFVSHWSNKGRVLGLAFVAMLIWGGHVLAAVADSAIPIWSINLALGIALVALPLRHFRVSRWAAGIAWTLFSGVALILRFTGSREHAIVGTVLLLILTFALAVHAGHWSAIDAVDDGTSGAVAVAGGCVAAALFAGAAAGLAFLLPNPWLDEGRVAALVTVWAAALALATGMLVALGSSFASGWRALGRLTPITGPVPSVNWVPKRSTAPAWRRPARPNQQAYGLEMVRELIKRTASRLYVGLWASAEYVVNLLLWSTYKFKRGARLGLNQLKALIVRSYRVVVHVAWLVAAWLRSFGTALRKAVTVAIRCCTETAVLVGLPLALLAAAAWLATAAAEETRRYLTDGALAALAELSGLDMLAIALATCAWTSLAGLPRLRESAGSALESATITGSYALLLIAFGGWLVGLPGTFGYGVIHVGWVTMGSTVALAAAFLLPQRRHEVPEGITTAGA